MFLKKQINYNYVFLFYDVEEKRVNKVFKKCKKYLNHWQKSVFRGALTNSQILELESKLKKIIDKEKDFISIIKIMDFKTIGETTLGSIDKNTEDIFLQFSNLCEEKLGISRNFKIIITWKKIKEVLIYKLIYIIMYLNSAINGHGLTLT